jgi:hypothetical protein
MKYPLAKVRPSSSRTRESEVTLVNKPLQTVNPATGKLCKIAAPTWRRVCS